jgi:hypothetical protein
LYSVRSFAQARSASAVFAAGRLSGTVKPQRVREDLDLGAHLRRREDLL